MTKVNAIIGLFIGILGAQTARAEINVHISTATILESNFTHGFKKLQAVTIKIKKMSDAGREVVAVLPICPELLKQAQRDGIAALEGIYDSVRAAEALKRSVQIEGRATGVSDKGLAGVCFTSISPFVKAEELASE